MVLQQVPVEDSQHLTTERVQCACPNLLGQRQQELPTIVCGDVAEETYQHMTGALAVSRPCPLIVCQLQREAPLRNACVNTPDQQSRDATARTAQHT